MEIIKNSFGPYDRFVEWLPTELVKKFREYDREDGDAEYLDGLTEQIKQNGITEPLILTYSRSTRKALLTEGNHRLAAAIRLGMTEVPVRVCLKEGDFNRGAGVVVPGFDETPYWNEDYKREITPHVPADMRPSDIGVGPFEKTAATPNPARIGAAVKQFCASNESYAILDSLITGGTWLAGGCWILAYALCEGFGGELYGVFAHGIPQHAVAKIGNQFIDGDGASTAAQLLHRWKSVERLPADTYLAPVNPTEVFAADKEMVAPPEEGRKNIISGIQKIIGTKTAATAPVDNPAFNSWFSGSEIVNDDGTPKVVYHSTYFNFDEFDRMFPVKKWNRPKSLDRIGIWFSDSSGENGAGMYSSDTGKGSNIIPAYLSMKNPLVFRTNVDGDAFVGLVKLWDRYHEQDKKFPRGTKKDRKQNSRWGDSEGFRDYLKQEGHDGVILKNTRGDSKVPQTMYIVFEPNQIKSAIGNKGTFDPGSNNITASHHDELLNLSWDADDYDKYLALKNVKFPLTVYRAVNIPSETSFRVNEAGECWTWDEKFANSYYGNGKRTPHIIRAVIDSPDKVDWVGTDLQNQQFGWSEKEIRVKVGSDLQFTGWRRADSREWKEPWVKSITAADTTASPVRIGAPPLAQQGITQTPQFKAWFSGSEVVDKQGNPLVMYHATQSDIGEFHAYTHFGTQGAANDRHQNLWDFYNDELKNPTRAQGSNIMPVYLSVKNALRMQDLAGIDDNTGAEIDEAAYATGEEYYPRGWEGEEAIPMTLYEMGIMDIDDFEEHRSNAEALKFLEQQGYDGIVYENVVEDPGNDSWIVFRPNQIKSAVGNSGEFSGGNSVTAANKSQFDTWFAGSKVITKEGAPLKVYHGTRRHFTKPRPLTHFGTRHAAQEAPNYSGVLMEFYLSIKRPFYTVDSAGGQDMWYWLQDAGKKGVITREEFSEWEGTADPLKGVELLESKGYDGIVYENGFEDAGNLSWVIFRSDQAVLVEKINSITAATKMPKFDEVFGQYGMYDEGVWNAPEESFRTVIAHDYDPDAEYGEQSNGWALNPDQRKDNQADNVDVLDAAIVASTHPVKYSYGLVEVVAPESIVGVIPFDEEDLMAKGVETEPHLTARYGILNNKIDGIRELATQYKPFKITLGKTSTFPPSKSSDNAVPVIIEVTSPELHELNAKLGGVADFKPSNFDDYRPHLTLAYVRPEAAEKYTGIDTLEGTEFEVTELVVSDPDDNKTVFPLDQPEEMKTASGDITQTPQFKTWFSGSKVVDALGKPLRLFHGTTHDFDEFDITKGDLGAHFGPEMHGNSILENGDGVTPVGSRMVPVYLSIKNPLRMLDRCFWEGYSIAYDLADAKVLTRRQADDLIDNPDRSKNPQKIMRDAIIAKGYDGVVYLNRGEATGDEGEWDHESSDADFLATYSDAKESWIAFYPNQIKSAIGNNGNFDPSSPKITASVERPRNEDMEDYVIAYLRQYPKGKPGVSDGLSRPDGSGEIVYRGHDGRVLGVMAYSPTEITDIAVHKDHRTRGIGTTMMEELRKRGISKFRPPMTEAGEAFAKKQAASTNRPLTQDEFYASRLEAYKKSEAENNGWRNSVLIYHGTDSITAEKITQSGRFKSGNDWPSFFTTRKSEATDYARIRAGQVKEHGKDAQPFVFALKVAPYAVHLNKGSGEVETHTGVPLYLDGTTVGYVKDADLIKSFERCNDPYWTYALYLKDYEQQGEASRELAGDAVDPELLAPIIVQGQVTGEKALKDFGFFELLNTYQWLKRKRDKKSKSLYQEVEKWGIRMQNKRKAEMEEREGKTSAVETEPTLLTDSPAFQTWFKGSKVTYTDGVTPQTVFHFTQSDFNIFNTDPRNTPGIILDTIGAWFTPSPNLANQVYGFYQDNRAVNRRGNPQVMYCYLSIKNPLITENRHYLWDVIQTKMCGSDMDRIKKFRADALRDQVQFVKDVKKQLVQQGYDGIFIENDYYGPAWVAFFPNQVKSALANNGNFSPEVHDITASEDDLKDFINSAEEHQPLAEAKTSSLKNPLMSKKTKK